MVKRKTPTMVNLSSSTGSGTGGALLTSIIGAGTAGELTTPAPTTKSSGKSGGSSGKPVNDYYNAILAQLGSSTITPETITYTPISYTVPEQEALAAQIAAYLRPQYDSAIASRRTQTTQNRAALDVDAASRGMGASTWVTDAKTRQLTSEAADVAALESGYGAALAQQVQALYNQHLQNRLDVDQINANNQLAVAQQNAANRLTAAQWNEQMRRALEETAYARALDAYNLSGSRRGSGVNTDKTSVTIR